MDETRRSEETAGPRPGDRERQLAALHAVARVLRRHDLAPEVALERVCELIPGCLRGPAAVRITHGRIARGAPGFREAPGMLSEEFVTARGTGGRVDVVGLEAGTAVGDTGLGGGREVVRLLAEMLRAHLDHREANAALERQTARLRALASEVILGEQRQRRAIAQDLHDHLGQALAFLRMQLGDLRGDLVLSGVDARLERLLDLLDRSIRYTRTLTAEISPPVLYELGLRPAVDWLADRMRGRHGLPVDVLHRGDVDGAVEAVRVTLFLALRELLVNAVKHARASRVEVGLAGEPETIVLRVADDGAGFDPTRVAAGDGFGLMSIRERIRSLGGAVEIDAAPGRGTSIEIRVPRGEETS